MDKIDELLTRGVEKIYPSRKALEKVLRKGKKLTLYQGFDPTGSLLHIGHLVGLKKLRQFQDFGHEVIFLIGDGTGQAGDPSGKSSARDKFMTRSELRNNAKTYVLQAEKVVKFHGKNKAKILYNSDWLNNLNLVDILNLFERFSVQQLLERDIFENRIKKRKTINLREFIYPLLQGYDSVAMKVDLEIGGTDQTFNMLTGRKLVKEILKKEKFVITLPLLADSAGKKIGKTEGNVIALTSPPNELYGMIMNLPDEAILTCFELITDISLEKIQNYKKDINQGINPMIYKKELAFTLVKMLNSEKDADRAQKYFETVIQNQEISNEIKKITVKSEKKISIIDLLTHIGFVKSKSEAKRLIKGSAVKINQEKIIDINHQIQTKNSIIIKVGKHKIAKIIFI